MQPHQPPRTAFVSASFAQRETLAPVLRAIEDACTAAGLRAHVFVNAYSFAPEDQRAMMARMAADIRASDLLIAEVSHKAIGVGIEVGYAAALDIPVIYLRHADAEPSTTVGGIADHALVYRDPGDLRARLGDLLRAVIS